ncbi:MAG: DUF1244 domain-containing protein [Saccharospirillaceae bacterium]|nr:DUF1244 domain-containing protein [Pseudomonadales bacterium]NRB80142.1 DUF1244 domain-containing protein [Saccharospirillaceae bacterium]
MQLDKQQQLELEAATFRRFIKHLDEHKEVQNIDLMITADFCRNCLSKWMLKEAKDMQIDMQIEDAHQQVYKMSYAQYKQEHQPPATQAQLDAFNSKKKA